METNEGHAMSVAGGNEDPQKAKDRIRIFIDKNHYDVEQETLTGAQLRALPDPDVPADRDIWQEVPGAGDDKKIGLDDLVHLKDGLHFYTSPKTINPGAR